MMQVRKGDLKHSEDTTTETDGFATVAESSIGKETVTKRTWSDDELVAQCVLFFLAGFDTSSTMLSFATNELALNPDIQEKLFDEVMAVHEKLNGSPLTYEAPAVDALHGYGCFRIVAKVAAGAGYRSTM